MNGEKKRARLDQRRAPIHEALENFRQMRVVPFDVPGHKRGRGNPELTAFLGQQCVGVDVNSMKPLDNLCHPVSVIREAEELAADAFGAAHAFLMVGGTTSSVQSMVLTACKRGDEIILPRNVHRSVLNALVLCGAVPVYVNPEVDKRLGISLGMKREQVEKAIREHPNAVAVLVNNPTYYGICSDLRAIVKMAHEAGMLCTVKHFPGHGDTGQDSHYGTATSYKTWEEMKAMEMLPFEAGIAAGADVVMTAHITTPNATTDGLPASLSYTMITERLRGELGFQGVIVTDALEMNAIKNHFAPAESAVAALRAGVDVLLMPSDLRAAFDGVVQAVEDGTLSEERLNESVRRILTLKQKAGLDLSGSSAAKQPIAEKTSDTKCSFSGWLKKLWYGADTAA